MLGVRKTFQAPQEAFLASIFDGALGEMSPPTTTATATTTTTTNPHAQPRGDKVAIQHLCFLPCSFEGGEATSGQDKLLKISP